MTNNKMTKKDWLGILLNMVNASDMENKEGAANFIKHEMELLERKASNSKETKTQKENLEVMEKIKNALAEIGKPVTITELQAASAEMAQYSNQRLSALLRKLKEAGEVVKTVEKKKSYFSIG